MDLQTIDNAYGQLQNQGQQTVQEIRGLANKLQAAAQAGDPNAREWLLDLRSIALSVQGEQNQVANLLQALNGYAQNQGQGYQPYPNQQFPQGGYPQQGYPQQGYPQQAYPQQQRGLFGGLFNSTFGQAIAAGAGFAIGDDIINDIF